MNLPNPIREGSGRAVIIAVYCVLCFLVRECAEKQPGNMSSPLLK